MPESTETDTPSLIKPPIVGVGAVFLHSDRILLIKRNRKF